MNNVTLVGRITKDPELRTIANGTVTTNITVAVNRAFTNASGEREADFINCVVWRKKQRMYANFAVKVL
jgi:single-strand DNA-binding protein